MKRDGTRPTIHDIARASGSSASTVSAALNGTWKERRIRAETVRQIKAFAADLGYSANLQARGLRKAKSGLVGMILPVHDSRFFSSISQHFATEVRRRGLCPVIVSSRRDPAEEVQSVEALRSYSVDSLFIAGATDPDGLSNICRQYDLPHVFIDLPSSHSPSVVGDNAEGAAILTRKIIELMPRVEDAGRGKIYFLGGVANNYASGLRLAAFREVVTAAFGTVSPSQILACGYAPANAAREVEKLMARIGGLPAGLFVNSISAFEGVLSHFAHLPAEAFAETAIGCYDYDPFGAFLQFPVHMVSQNTAELVRRAFALLDDGAEGPVLEKVTPELVRPRTMRAALLGQIG